MKTEDEKRRAFFVFGILNNVAYSQVLATEQVDTDSEQVTWDKELCFKTARLPLSGIIQVGSSDVYIDILQDTLPDNFTPTEESLEGVEWKPQLVAAKVLEIEEHTYGH